MVLVKCSLDFDVLFRNYKSSMCCCVAHIIVFVFGELFGGVRVVIVSNW